MPLLVHGQEVVSVRNLAATAGTQGRLLRAHRRHGLGQRERTNLMENIFFKRLGGGGVIYIYNIYNAEI